MIGPNFANELRTAGMAGLKMSWSGAGDIQFDSSVTEDQRSAVAAVLAAHDPLRVPTDADLQTRIANGLTVQFNANPALNGRYSIGPDSRNNITALATSIAVGLGLPLGASTVAYLDVDGAPHQFTADQFKQFAAAMRDYYYALVMAAAQLDAGAPAAWPATTTTVS